MSTSMVVRRLERLPLSWLHYRLLFIHGFGWLFDAMDVGIITFVIAALSREWKLSAGQIGLIGSSGLAGMFVGALLSGIVADRYGRRTVFQWTLLIYTLFTALCAIAWNVPSMILFRFFVGVGLGGELPVVSSLLSEFIPAGFRGRFLVWLESFWALGWLAAALIAFLIIPAHGWRIAFLLGCFPAAYIAVIRWRLPESPRWYAIRGREADAERVVAQLEAESVRRTGRPLPAVTEGEESEPAANKGWLTLWSVPYRQRTLMLWILWFGLVFGYYGIFVWLPTLLLKAGYSLVNSFSYVILITVVQIPGYFSAAILVERLGRKAVITSYLTLSAIAAFFFAESQTTHRILWSASAMSFFNLGAWGAVYAYTPELYPTQIRATGTGAAAAFGRLGGIFAPIIVGAMLPSIGRSGVLLLNTGMFLMSAVAVVLLGTETKGKVI